VTYKPEGWPTVATRIFVEDPLALVAFMREVFGAVGDDPGRGPAEMRIDDSLIMVSGIEFRGKVAGFLYVYVPDASETYARAVAAGAETIEPPVDVAYGDRRATVSDPWGNVWQIATRLA
jgi:uncharacterized glyoxalase superfamily protein PhnB